MRRPFSLVMAPYGILQSLTKESDLAAALASVARVLRKGGLFGIDLVPDLPRWSEYDRRVSLAGRRGRSTTLTLDKASGNATLQQKLLLWRKRPVEFPLSDIDDIAVKSDQDPMSGASIHHSVIHRRTGEIAVLTTEEASDAAETVKKLRAFVGR